MNVGNRIPALQETIKRVSEFATCLEPSGMSIRFLNFGRDGDFNNLTDVNDIMQKVQMVDYEGNTRLGQWLQIKIVGPMIIQKAESNTLQKPVIVAVITDGEVSLSNTSIGGRENTSFTYLLQPNGEPSTSLGNTIRRCKNWPALRKLGEAAVVFLLCRVGDNDEAEAFLKAIEKEEKLKDMVYVSPDRVDDKLAIFQKCGGDDAYRNWVSPRPAIDS